MGSTGTIGLLFTEELSYAFDDPAAVIFLAGVMLALRRRSPMRTLLLPIVYVPLTICFVLTNMRYTITVQPLLFAFVAMTLVAACGLEADAQERRLPR